MEEIRKTFSKGERPAKTTLRQINAPKTNLK